MFETEEQLLAGLQRSRTRLIESAREFGEALRSTLDPLTPVQQDPLGSVLASMAAGVIVGSLGSNRAPDERAERRSSTFVDLLWGALPLVLPVLQTMTRRDNP